MSSFPPKFLIVLSKGHYKARFSELIAATNGLFENATKIIENTHINYFCPQNQVFTAHIRTNT